ncbi:unnamed protein product [Candida verbasci]|uniref:ADF-H domain-containing protein n=1 Tax=Candida verbasci TaxID=1227364 RepID=A0A9W4TUK4_9ASCO|nr:unnamed protein product [Candida verbasci]
MSSQSGITISQELLNVYKKLRENDSLVIKVNDSLIELIPDENYKSNSNDIFGNLKSYIKNEYPQPGYIIVVMDSIQYFISFIPDNAPIKQKMLYASTKNTILNNLGSNNFTKKLNFTELDELNLGSLEDDGVSAPLNDDEKILKDMNNMELENVHGYKKELASMSSSDILYKFDLSLIEQFENLDNKLVIFNIDLKNEVIKLIENYNNIKVNDLISKLESVSVGGPKYVLYNYGSGLAFIYTCPSGSPVKERMIYASFKNTLITELKSKYDVKIDKDLEVGDLEELEISELQGSEVTESPPSSASSSNLKFSKPKGPRRR